jgi:hypothetical protein
MTRVKLARGVALRPLRPLGEILVEWGAISSAELDGVLLEQRTTHKRMGAMLVVRGTLSQPVLTDALKDQLSALGPPPSFERDGALGSITRLLRPRQTARLHPAGRGWLPELTRDLERRVRTAAARGSHAADKPRQADARIAAELADLRAELNHTSWLVMTQGVQIAKLLARTPDLSVPTDDIGAEPPPVADANLDERPSESASFLLFKPAGGGGYELLEREGWPPTAGETLEIDKRRFTVTRIGRSPLPVDRRPCIYLQAF